MTRDPYFVGDWESACVMLECEREECRTPEGYIFQAVLPYRASLVDVQDAWRDHLQIHLEQDASLGAGQEMNLYCNCGKVQMASGGVVPTWCGDCWSPTTRPVREDD